MDLDAFKLLLEAQERTIRGAMDIIVDQQNSRIKTLESTIEDLIKSLKFTEAEVCNYSSEIKALQKDNSDSKATIEDLKSKVEELEKRSNSQDDFNRRKNLRITGLREQAGGESWEQTSKTVSEFLEKSLQLPPLQIENAHRVGPVAAAQPRTVVVKFEKFGDREAVRRNARKLKGTGVFVNEDLCAVSQKLKRSQFPKLRQARLEGKIAFFKHTKLIIKERSGTGSTGIVGAPPPLISSRRREQNGGD